MKQLTAFGIRSLFNNPVVKKLVFTIADIRGVNVLMFVTVRSILTNIALRSLSHSFETESTKLIPEY